jgi:hypothetical protein
MKLRRLVQCPSRAYQRAALCVTAKLARLCPLWVMCGRRLIDKSFFTLMQHWSGAVMCPACLCGADGRWP